MTLRKAIVIVRNIVAIRFRPGELPLVILAILERGPRTGYELLQELGRLLGPSYRPSPGSVYPALNALLDERLVVPATNGRGKELRLASPGRQVLEQRRAALADIEARTGLRLGADASFAPVLARVAARLAPLEGRIDPDVVEAALAATVDELEALDASGRRGAGDG